MSAFRVLYTEIERLPNKDVKVLEVLLRNIIEYPNEPKYRKVRLANHSFKQVWEHAECRTLLEYLGFISSRDKTTEENYLLFPSEVSTEPLAAAQRQLSTFLSTSMVQSAPPSSSSTSATTTASSSHVADAMTVTYLEPVNDEGQTQMHIAAAVGNVPMITYLITVAPETVNFPDTNGWLPLHEAVRGGELPAVRCLVEEGHSDVSARTSNGGTALWWARQFHSDHDPVVTYLRSLNALDIGPDPTHDSSSNSSSNGGGGGSGGGPMLCQICTRELRIETSRGSALFRASRPCIAIECMTCKQYYDHLASSNDGATTSSPGTMSNNIAGYHGRFIICGQCFNNQSHGHNMEHLFDVYGGENTQWRDGGRRHGGRPPPRPDPSNRRGPWG